MRKNKRRKRKQKLIYFRLILLIILLIAIINMVRGIMARYKSSAGSQATVDLAYYLINAGSISQDLKLSSILPRDNPYTYTISIANNNGQDRTETALEYTIELKTTTNLPLTYKIYKQGTTTDLISSTTDLQDDDDTYFKDIITSSEEFGFSQNEQSIYCIDITFPRAYNLAQYEGIIEYIQVIVNSKQKV